MDSFRIADVILREVQSTSKTQDLRESWKRLLKELRTCTPFQTWEWNTGILEYEGEDVRPSILLGENGSGKVIGIAPLCVRKERVTGIKVLELIGTRKSDYLDCLVLEAYRTSFLQQVATWIEENPEWQMVDLQCVRQDLVDVLCCHCSLEAKKLDVCPYAILPSTIELYEKKISNQLRKLIRRRIKILDKTTDWKVSISRTPSEIEGAVKHLIRLHQRRQISKGERGRFSERRWRESFENITNALAREELVRLGILWIDNQAAAALYNLRMRDQEYVYLAGMEPRMAQYSPGTVLLYRMIGEAIADGIRVYDFLRGGEGYKNWWTDGVCKIFRAKRSRSRLVAAISEFEEKMRYKIQGNRLIKQAYRNARRLVEQ
jgi:CelD/BcsL family acetyltransferase involved in cellulose biosynthesis